MQFPSWMSHEEAATVPTAGLTAWNALVSERKAITGYDGQVSARDLLLKTAQAYGIYVGSRADYQRMLDFMTKHHMRPVIDRVYPVEEYAEALEHLELIGKVVLRL